MCIASQALIFSVPSVFWPAEEDPSSSSMGKSGSAVASKPILFFDVWMARSTMLQPINWICLNSTGILLERRLKKNVNY
jgi:hypothetical protein